jgi:glycosyltransferase involved in cell wall biosynthesis
MPKPVVLGLTLIGSGHWTGGETYLRNMLGVMAQELQGRLEARLFLSPAQAEKLAGSLDHLLPAPPVVHAAFDPALRGRQMPRTLLTGSNTDIAAVFQSAGVDVVWESAVFLGRSFPLPVLSWLPDFQHRHLGHLFSRRAWWRRDIGFRLQTGTRRTVLLSSEDARRDCETFYPASRGRTAVVRFAIDLDPATHIARRGDIISRHGLPERYVYLPNQFWSHKNHAVVVDALGLLKARGALEAAMPVILTGNTKDPRDPGGFERLMARAAEAGVAGHFRYLGLVPYEDVFALNAAADALLNPSRFEGWSTTVEEAKALGTRLILSDLGVHREQAPEARFFNHASAEDLASALRDISSGPALRRADAETLRTAHAARRTGHANALLAACEAAIRLGPPRGR